MEQYIPKSVVVAEIEKLLDRGKYHEEYDCAYRDGNNGALYALKNKLDTLEVKESGDEQIREVLIDYFNRYKEQEECGVKTFYGIPTDNILAWLKSINKPLAPWKPSDEQMVQLSKYCPDNIALTSLYEHLKKLKE